MEGYFLPILLFTLWVVYGFLSFFKDHSRFGNVWRSKGVNILPYLDDFLFLIIGRDAGCLLAKIIEEAMRRAGLTNNWDKYYDTPKHERRHLGFNVDLANGLFKVLIERWEALREVAADILKSKGS